MRKSCQDIKLTWRTPPEILDKDSSDTNELKVDVIWGFNPKDVNIVVSRIHLCMVSAGLGLSRAFGVGSLHRFD